MAALSGNGIVGRAIRVYRGDPETGTAFIAQTKTLNFNSESIDVTSDTDEGFQTLLADPSVRSINMSVEGVLRQDDFVEGFINPDNTAFLEQWSMEIPGIGVITCDFFLNGFELSAPHDAGTTFSTEIQSSGKWDFTPEVVA